MESTEIISLLLGALATLAAVVGNQFRNMKIVLALQIVANALVSVQYILEGTAATSVVVYIAIVQISVSMYFNMKGKKFPLPLCILFIAAYSTSVLSLYSGPQDILTLFAMFFCAVSVVQTKSWIYRITLVANLTFWLAYDVIMAPSAIIFHAPMLIFTLVAMVRLDRGELSSFFKKILKGK